jgi:flavin-dependent dehydrogenase
MSLESEYRKWWKKLSKEDKKLLKQTGFDYKNWEDDGVPIAHRYFGGETEKQNDDDNKRVPDFSNGYDINFNEFKKWIGDKYKQEGLLIKDIFTFDEVLEIVNRIISVLDESNDRSVKLHATCIKIALGVPSQPSMTSLANEHNLTRAAVSLRVKTIQKNFGLAPSIYMKSEHACSKLSKARKKKL